MLFKYVQYFVRFGHSDDPGAVQRHFVVFRMGKHLFGDVGPTKSSIQSGHVETTSTLIQWYFLDC